jgi:hypothetical protein
MSLPNTIETLRTLVGFNTVSANSNRQLIDWVANRLEAIGVTPFAPAWRRTRQGQPVRHHRPRPTGPA